MQMYASEKIWHCVRMQNIQISNIWVVFEVHKLVVYSIVVGFETMNYVDGKSLGCLYTTLASGGLTVCNLQWKFRSYFVFLFEAFSHGFNVYLFLMIMLQQHNPVHRASKTKTNNSNNIVFSTRFYCLYFQTDIKCFTVKL